MCGFITVIHVSKCMSYHKVTVTVTKRTHCFHDFLYYTHLTSERLECLSYHGLLIVSYIPIIYIYSRNKEELKLYFNKTTRTSSQDPLYDSRQIKCIFFHVMVLPLIFYSELRLLSHNITQFS